MRPKSSVGAQTPLQALVRSQFARANEMMGDVLYKPLLDQTIVFHMTITILGFSYDDNVENMGLYMLVDFTQIIWLVVYLPPLKNMKHEKCSKPPIRQLLVGKHAIDPQIIQVMNDHDLVLKPMVFWDPPS
jgi:hypothetical protein